MKTTATKPNTLFWVIGIFGLVWNALGVNRYINQAYQTERFKLMHSEAQLEIIFNLPAWVKAVFAIAVFSSLLACILLLLRKKLAKTFFLIGLIAVFVETFYHIFMNTGNNLFGVVEYAMLIIVPLFAMFLYWYTKKCADDEMLT
tara:strand:+ start:113 stop:547 length:435 start_codon:yes stop_codon:yes gene_type:complete